MACLLNTFIRTSNTVEIACIAQSVNVIAPAMTDPMGAAVKSPTYDADVAQNVPYSDATGVQDGAYLTFFVLNRHGTDILPLEILLSAFGAAAVVDHQAMTADSLRAVKMAGNPMAVAPRAGSGGRDGRWGATGQRAAPFRSYAAGKTRLDPCTSRPLAAAWRKIRGAAWSAKMISKPIAAMALF